MLTDKQLNNLFRVMESFSNDVRMSFDLDKCKTLSSQRGKVTPQTFDLEADESLGATKQGDYYKYLELL